MPHVYISTSPIASLLKLMYPVLCLFSENTVGRKTIDSFKQSDVFNSRENSGENAMDELGQMRSNCDQTHVGERIIMLKTKQSRYIPQLGKTCTSSTTANN